MNKKWFFIGVGSGVAVTLVLELIAAMIAFHYLSDYIFKSL